MTDIQKMAEELVAKFMLNFVTGNTKKSEVEWAEGLAVEMFTKVHNDAVEQAISAIIKAVPLSKDGQLAFDAIRKLKLGKE